MCIICSQIQINQEVLLRHKYTHLEMFVPVICYVIADAWLKAMLASRHAITSVRALHIINFLGRHSAAFLRKFCNSMDSGLGVGATDLMK